MFKKILKITGILLVVIIASGFAVPYFFKDQIKAKIQQTINENLNAKVSFTDADVSLFKSFPKATVTLNKLAIVNKAPFEGDTLVATQQLDLKMSLGQLFNGENEPMTIEGVDVENALINIIINKDGVGNYDIALKDNAEESKSESKPMALKLQNYNIENLKFKFTNEGSNMKLELDSIYHTGKGDFTNDVLDLDTETKTQVSFSMDKANYMNHVPVSLDAVLGIDLKNSKYTFKENEAKINALPLKFNGFLQLKEKGQLYDLTFETPTSSFENFLKLIPADYQKSLSDVKTTGDFTVKGFAKGELTETTVPKFNIALASNNASFKYASLLKTVKNIVIDTKVVNETGNVNDTYVDLNKFSFAIDQDVFNAKANIKNLAENPLVDAALKGTINLGNLSQAYPIKLDTPLSGILNADAQTKFDMASIDKGDYAKVYSAGVMSLSGFKYVDENGKAMNISTARVKFNPSQVNLEEFRAKTGKSDIAVTGVINQFYGYLFKKQNLQGNFNMTSNQIAVADFMTEAKPATDTKKATSSEAMKIPAFLDCTLSAKANTVLYDNLTLKNVAGKLIIKDEKVTLQNVATDIFDGNIGLNGFVSTKEKTPVFDMNLGLNKVDIAQTCTQLDMFKKILPIAGVLNGKINSNIKLKGNLDAKEMTPVVNSLTGDLFGQLLSTTINEKNATLIGKLDDKLGFIDLKKLNLNDIKAMLTFNDGKVTIKPFDIKYQDIKVTVGGTHGFDQSMAYNLKFDVPAKYLGNEVGGLLAKLTPAQQGKLENIPINATMTGSFSNPKISTDVKQATTALAANIAKQQKDKYLNQGATKLESVLNNSTKGKDSTKVKQTVNQAKDLLNGLFKKKNP